METKEERTKINIDRDKRECVCEREREMIKPESR